MKEKKRSMLSLLKKFIPYYKPYKGMLIFDLFCAAIVTGADLLFPTLVKIITNKAITPTGTIMSIIIGVAITLIAMRLIEILCQYYINFYGHIMGSKIETDLRRDMFNHLLRLPHSYYDNAKTGVLMSRLTNDLFDITEFSHHCPEEFFMAGLKIVGIFTILMFSNVILTLCLFAFVPFMIWFSVVYNLKLEKAFLDRREKTADINAQAEDSLAGIRVVKSFANEDIERHKFELGNQNFLKAKKHSYKNMAIFNCGIRAFDAIMYILIIVLGGILKIDAGTFIAYLLYATTLLATIRTITEFTEQYQKGITAIRRFDEIMSEKVALQDTPNAQDIDNISGKIELQNVSFAYENVGEKVIDGLNLEINKGEVVAVVGPSGGGKTTLSNLIPRFYEVSSGNVFIDDIDIRNITLSSLRRNIGVVQQDVYLFWGTVKENIAYGKPNATDDEIKKAADLAGATEFINKLENGFNSFVGERGVKLSGGQKQRISIARVFLKNPPILILDEATSALDNESEVKVQKSLELLSSGRTTLVIAHRLSTIRNATKIIVLTEKGILESGTHKELITKNGVYKKLYELSSTTEGLII